MELLDLPIEILEDIILKIRDTNSFKNLRISCKTCYSLMQAVKRFYVNKKIKCILNFKNHLPVYQHLYWYPNGFLKSIYNYKKGTLFGECFKYYFRGNIKFKGNYDFG